MEKIEKVACNEMRSKIAKIDSSVMSRLSADADLETLSKVFEIVSNTPKKKVRPTKLDFKKVGGIQSGCKEILKQHYISQSIELDPEEVIGALYLEDTKVEADSQVIVAFKAVALTGVCRDQNLADEVRAIDLIILKLFSKGGYVTKQNFIDSIVRNGNHYRDEIVDALEEILEVKQDLSKVV